MSPSSSSSWPGGRGGDIIDLDRYMRGNVRPSRTLSKESKEFERLVVDAGGVCKPCSSASGDARGPGAGAGAGAGRYSHDSGVSDGSYRRPRRNHRPHRRYSGQDGPNIYPSHEPTLVKTLSGRANSSSSLRAFRTVCEQALLDQQRQIARVAELCERLTERAEKTSRSEKGARSGPERTELPERDERPKVERVPSAETSEISSSSRSTKDPRQKDKHRTQECKTYKIIMNKLDELNRLFSTRPPPPRPARPPPSSTSVSVCDKLISTDLQRTVNRVLAPTVQWLQARAARRSLGAVSHAYAVDITPARTPLPPRNNVATESIIVKDDSSSNGSQSCAGDPRCGFDLDDPVHLYSQAKRLQALTTRTRRAHSVEPSHVTSSWIHERAREHAREHAGSEARALSLCAVCRGYWRYLRQCVVPVFGRTVDACKCS